MYDEQTEDYMIQNTNRIYQVLSIAWTILGVTCGIVVTLGVAFMRPSVGMVFREVDLATAALMAVPRVAVEANYALVRQVMNMQDKKKRAKKAAKIFAKESETTDTTSQVSTTDVGRPVDAQSDTSSVHSGGADDDNSDSDSDDDGFEMDDNSEGSTGGRAGLFWKYTAQYGMKKTFDNPSYLHFYSIGSAAYYWYLCHHNDHHLLQLLTADSGWYSCGFEFACSFQASSCWLRCSNVGYK